MEMNCCTNCFSDKEIVGFIISNSNENGTCDFCGNTGVSLIDVRELEEIFQPVVNLFQSLPTAEVVEVGQKLVHERIQDMWNVFRLPEEKHGLILSHIFKDNNTIEAEFFSNPVEVRTLENKDEEDSLHERKWNNFADEIKSKNRFFLTETIDLDLLNELLEYFSKTYDKGKIFYRARISEREGIEMSKMGKPPSEKSTAGRANPKGIPYLYVSTKQDTTVYESRSSHLDYITIAEFRVIETLRVVSLREIASTSPFVFGERLSNYITHQKYLIRLERELSKPIRKFDKELDYLPSQYLCEYVKSLGYDAIEYGSSTKEGGINLAIFNDGKLEIKSTEIFEVTSMELKYKKI